MSATAPVLVALCAGIMLMLGLTHLAFTFRGSRLTPRDAEVRAGMERSFPVITRQTTVWRAWIGFNATHSLGLILFGALYGYLSIFEASLLFRSVFLLGLGLLTLVAYAGLARAYFFRVPFRGVIVATLLYSAALMLAG